MTTPGVQAPHCVAPLSCSAASSVAGTASKAKPGSGSEDRAGARFALEFLVGGDTERFELAPGDNLVGRGKAASIRLDFPDLSRKHATVTLSGGRVLVRDEDSRNHTFVSGDRIDEEREVAPGTSIVFGRLEARLIDLREKES